MIALIKIKILCSLQTNLILPGPGHSLTLQILDSVFTPMQYAPPYLGFGLVQNRSLLCVPLPHEVEHDDQVCHAAHEPLTNDEIHYDDNLTTLEHVYRDTIGSQKRCLLGVPYDIGHIL